MGVNLVFQSIQLLRNQASNFHRQESLLSGKRYFDASIYGEWINIQIDFGKPFKQNMASLLFF